MTEVTRGDLAPHLSPHLSQLARYRKPVEDLGLASLAMHVVAGNFPAIEEEDEKDKDHICSTG